MNVTFQEGGKRMLLSIQKRPKRKKIYTSPTLKYKSLTTLYFHFAYFQLPSFTKESVDIKNAAKRRASSQLITKRSTLLVQSEMIRLPFLIGCQGPRYTQHNFDGTLKVGSTSAIDFKLSSHSKDDFVEIKFKSVYREQWKR